MLKIKNYIKNYVKNISIFNIINKILYIILGCALSFCLFFSIFLFVKPMYSLGPHTEFNLFFIILNIISIILVFYLINIKNKILKYTLIFIFSLFTICELSSLYFLGNDINTTFLVNITDINFIKNGIKLRPFLTLSAILSFILSFIILIFTTKITIIKSKVVRYALLVPFTFYLFSPFGFLYRVGYESDVAFVIDLVKYAKYDYNEIYNMITGSNYLERKDLIINNSGNKKNLVIIYLESFEQEYLYNDYLKNYTPFLKSLSEESEFHYNLKQLENMDYTTSSMFGTMCGMPLKMYITDKTILSNADSKMVCLPNILKRAGYKQVFVGGAMGELFHKKDLFDVFEFDEFYDRTSIGNIVKGLKFSSWGVYDKDLFEFAKTKYLELSKTNQPFNLTMLTLATHNDDGVKDERCKNSDKITLANGVECTDSILKDFIEFLKKQPNYKDTLILILPDHVQYNENTLKHILNDKDKKMLYTILLNSNKKGKTSNDILYVDIPLIILDNLEIKTNAKFTYSDLNKSVNSKLEFIEKNERLNRVFLRKIGN